jgi:hypothetical protein
MKEIIIIIIISTLSPSCAVVMISGNLNFLEPSGPFQACNGTALPLPLLYLIKQVHVALSKECLFSYFIDKHWPDALVSFY